MTSIKHFSTWADRILNAYPVGPAEVEVLSDFDEMMARNGLSVSRRHKIIEDFLNHEAIKGKKYSFRMVLEHLESRGY